MRTMFLWSVAAVAALCAGVALAEEAAPTGDTPVAAPQTEATTAEQPAATETVKSPEALKAEAEARKAAEAEKRKAEVAAKRAAEAEKRKAEAEARKAAAAAATKSFGGGRFAVEPAFQDDFLPGWEKNQKDWAVATWMQNGTQMAPERCATDGKGFLVQTVLAGDPPRGGSMESKKEFRYGRWVGRIKPAPVAGALNSFFTIDWDNQATPEKSDGSKLEIDIEFVTASFGEKKGQVEFAVHHLGDKKSFGKVIDLDFNPSDEFHVWGFDILPEGIIWHVDGKVLHEYKCPAGESIPDIHHEFFMNSWTAVKWVRGPAKADAKYTIDWVRFYPLVKK